MKTIKKLLVASCMLVFVCCMSVAAFSFAEGETTTPTSLWQVDTNKAGVEATVNADSSITVNTANAPDPFNQSVLVWTAHAGQGELTDVVFKFNLKMSDNGSPEIPFTFNYGVPGVGQANLTFYYQTDANSGNRAYTNTTLGGVAWPAEQPATYTMSLYNQGHLLKSIGPTQDGAFGSTIITPYVQAGWEQIGQAEGHDLVVRYTKTETGVLISIYYNTNVVDENKLFYTMHIETPAATVTGTFLGFTQFASQFTLSNPVVENYVAPEAVTPVQSMWNNQAPAEYFKRLPDGSVSVNAINDASNTFPFNQGAWTAAESHKLASYDDIYYVTNLYTTDNGVAEQPVSFNYGILGGGQVNMTFYYQTVTPGVLRTWTNGVIGGESLNAQYQITTYKAGVQHQQTELKDAATATNFGAFGVDISELGFANPSNPSGHDIVFRFTKTEDGVLARMYYGTNTIDDAKLVYSLKIVSEAAKNIQGSFFGANVFNSVYKLSNVTAHAIEVDLPDYTVTFNSDGGSVVEAQTIEQGSVAVLPTAPTKDGFNFVRWELNGEEYDFSTPVTGDITLVAVWAQEIVEYTVTFNADNGTEVKTATVIEGNKVAQPENPVKEGNKFLYWALDGNEYNFDTPVAGDITLTAVYEVVYTNNWVVETKNVGSAKVNQDKTIEVNTIGNSMGNAFNQAVYTQVSTGNLNSYKDVAVAFNFKATDNGAADQPITINVGMYAGGQFNATFYYQTLEGNRRWTNAVCGGENFGATYTMTVYSAGVASATVGPNTGAEQLGFGAFFATIANSGLKAFGNENGHDIVVRLTDTTTGMIVRVYYDTAVVDSAKLLYELNVVTKMDLDLSQAFVGFNIFNTQFVLTDATYAEIAPFTVTFNSDGGTEVETQTVAQGGFAVVPTAPTKEGFEFVRWELEGQAFNFNTTAVTGNITLKAVWAEEVTKYNVTFDAQNDTQPEVIPVIEGNLVDMPEAPVKENYAFLYWAVDGAEYDFNTPVTADITLVAVWERIHVWKNVNVPPKSYNFEGWDDDTNTGSFEVNDMGADRATFFQVQTIAKFSDFATIDETKDYAVTMKVKIDEVDLANNPETQLWFYLYKDTTNQMGSALQNNAALGWTNAFTYGVVNGGSSRAISQNGKNQIAAGASHEIVNTALSLGGLISGTTGRARTFTIVYSVVENTGIWQRIYLHDGDEFDIATATPIYQALLIVEDTSAWKFADMSFGMRFFNANATVSNVEVTAVEKVELTIPDEPNVNGDMGNWTVNKDLPGATISVENGAFTISDTRSSTAVFGVPLITTTIDSLANGKEWRAEKDYVIGLNAKLTGGDAEMSVWFDLVGENNTYIGVGMFRQAVANEYRWTNSCVVSDPTTTITGYTYEKYGETSVYFEDAKATLSGVLGVPSVAQLKPWDVAEGHNFYIRVSEITDTETGVVNTIIRVYYDYGEGVNFFYDEEIVKTVIEDCTLANFEDMKFGIRIMNTTSTVSNFTFENYSVLAAQGELEGEPEPPETPDDPDTPSKPNKKKGCGSAFAGVAGTLAAVVTALGYVIVNNKRK